MRKYSLALRSDGQEKPLLELRSTKGIGLDIEFTAQTTDLGIAASNSHLRIYGLSLEMISKANDFTGSQIKMYAGYEAGMQLAKPEQYGLIIDGSVLQAIGGWQGTEHYIDLFIIPPTGTQAGTATGTTTGTQAATGSVEYNLYCPKDGDIVEAIITSIKLVMPNVGIVNSSKPVIQATEFAGHYLSLGELAAATGISITYTGNKVTLYSQSNASAADAKQIGITDMIGNATWVKPNTISFATALRGDITISDIIELPKHAANQSRESGLAGNPFIVTGRFMVTSILQSGRYGDATEDAWTTTIEAVTE